MSDCVVLNDANVHEILISLSRDEIYVFIDKIASALKDFSVSGDREYQPEASIINRPDGRKILFRLFTSSTGVGVKILVDPARALLKERTFESEAEKNRLTSLHGILALCDENGFANGFINAEEVTGHRTSISAILLYTRRKETSNIVVFGAGKQALWHIRLVLALRGDEIKTITIVNRSAERTHTMLEQIKKENEAQWRSSTEFRTIIDSDSNSKVEEVMGQADVIFCTTPSKEILFPANYVTNRKNCYISAIGSWQGDMIEVDPEVLKYAAGLGQGEGIVVVDDLVECRHGSGEIIQSQLDESQVVEVGALLKEQDQASKEDGGRARCLKEGFVVYKSVGVSVTDLAAGQALLQIARQRRLGIAVPNF